MKKGDQNGATQSATGEKLASPLARVDVNFEVALRGLGMSAADDV